MYLSKKRKSLLIASILLVLLSVILSYIIIIKRVYQTYYVKFLSEPGQELLNEYEFPWYLVEITDENEYCLRPYDVGDGVMTFGPGVTYPTKEDGINDINKRYSTNYSNENDCILVDNLFELQQDILISYEKDVYNTLFLHGIRVSQNEFDALVLLDYNSPEFIDQEEVLNVLKSEGTKEEYIEAINNYYKLIDSYYDNPNTDELNDGFGQGWYNRIVDSAEVFYDNEYEFQNNAEY